jgi:thioredoxin-dependent peroxiredoxin
MALQVGDRAPDFSLPDQNGQLVSLSQFAGRPVVLYFYPKDDTPGCTAEACAFRDQYSVFQEAGAVIIGVSGDSVADHQKFATKHKLPFLLISDQGSSLRKAYGVPSTLFVLPGRVTYVIDQKGIIRLLFNSMLDFAGHVDQALQVIQGLATR